MTDYYQQLINTDVRNINEESLVDISKVSIKESLNLTERKKSFVEQIINPYCYKCNGIIVKVSYAKNGLDLAKDIEDFINSKFEKE